MRVAIVGGSGALGDGLALRLGRAGVPVVFGSRDTERAAEVARRASSVVPEGSFSGTENSASVEGVDVVVLSVPFRNQAETLGTLSRALRVRSRLPTSWSS